jgi:hypothetical protein
VAFERRTASGAKRACVVEQTLQSAPVARGHARAEKPVIGLARLERAGISEPVQGQSLETSLAELVGMGIEAKHDAAASGGNAPAQPAVVLGASIS